MAGNPPESKWRNTPQSARKRKQVKLTLSDETIERLGALEARYGSWSATVDHAVESLARRLKLP